MQQAEARRDSSPKRQERWQPYISLFSWKPTSTRNNLVDLNRMPQQAKKNSLSGPMPGAGTASRHDLVVKQPKRAVPCCRSRSYVLNKR